MWDTYFLNQEDASDSDSTAEDMWDIYFLNQEDVINDAEIAPDNNKSAEVFSKLIPPNASDPKSADSLIASQMAKLSVADREKAYMDVHGIPDLVAETPELIQKSLLELQHEIDMLPDKKAYSFAARVDAKYVQDRDFCLACLRCEKFDCQKAAIRIIRHFQMKLDLFGVDKLVMRITQDDLETDDMDALYSSTGRFLNVYDTGGRIINLIVQVRKMFKTDAILRRGFYNLVTAYHDVEIQRRGFVSVVLHSLDEIKNTSADNAELVWKMPKLNEGSPMYMSALHLCYSEETWEGLHALVKTSLSQKNQARCRVHHGTVLECLERLRGNGIDPSSIPVNDRGEITDHFEDSQRLEKQRCLERLKYPIRSTIGVPFCEDVLLGKGTPFQIHTGNRKLRKIVVDRHKEYEKAKKGRKKVIAQECVDAIRSNGGLFLKQDGNKWFVVDIEVAIKKVGALFRSLRLRKADGPK
ncbi:unnamed protein product [Cylindrotheca closterium]|uniref:4Fe-4S ferredoxin-type domain-containing protein n=1 Tax=Cylindrotheca closterium TaxID=2856 RepID=A0AAD2G6W1_9STRA|nr:unnamed protein product [Cylindrotheca closterium]